MKCCLDLIMALACFHTCSSRSRISLMMVPVSSIVWISWVQFWDHKNVRMIKLIILWQDKIVRISKGISSKFSCVVQRLNRWTKAQLMAWAKGGQATTSCATFVGSQAACPLLVLSRDKNVFHTEYLHFKARYTPSRRRQTSGDESRLRGRLTSAASGSKVALTHQADTRQPSSTSVLRFSHALVHQLNSQSEWSDGPTDRRAPTPIQHVELAEKKTTRTNFSRAEHTERTYLADEQKLPDGWPSAWCVTGLRLQYATF